MRLLFVLICILYSFSVFCQAPNFVDGVEAYKQQNFKKSKDIFSQLVEANPNNPVLLFNLGLAEFNTGNPGMALGLWRKARFFDPSSQPVSQAIDFVEEQLFPEQSSNSFLATVYLWLKNLPQNLWFILCLSLFFTASWVAIEKGIKQSKPLLQWPPWVFAAIPLFLFTLFFSIQITIDKQQLRATVISKEVRTHTTPSATSPTLSQLQEGQEVIVEKSFNEWAQIRTPSGSPGWVLQKNLIAFRR